MNEWTNSLQKSFYRKPVEFLKVLNSTFVGTWHSTYRFHSIHHMRKMILIKSITEELPKKFVYSQVYTFSAPSATHFWSTPPGHYHHMGRTKAVFPKTAWLPFHVWSPLQQHCDIRIFALSPWPHHSPAVHDQGSSLGPVALLLKFKLSSTKF